MYLPGECYNAVKYEKQSVHNCQFVHHANFHCIMTTLNKVFKNAFEGGGGGGGLEKSRRNKYVCLDLVSLRVNLKGQSEQQLHI